MEYQASNLKVDLKKRYHFTVRSAIIVSCIVTALIVAAIVFALNIYPFAFASERGFGIYLSESNQLVISDKDIVFYNKSSYEIKLTEEGVQKVEALKIPVYGLPFVLKIDGKEVYGGSFWTPISSVPSSGIVIEVFEIKDSIIRLEKGYPTSEFFRGPDQRNNSQIFDYFQKIGKA